MRDLRKMILLDKVNVLIKFLYMSEKHYIIYENYDGNYLKITMNENFDLSIIDLEFKYKCSELENKFSVSDYIDVISYLEKHNEFNIITDVVLLGRQFKETKRMKKVINKYE
jgi:hypothetical protein